MLLGCGGALPKGDASAPAAAPAEPAPHHTTVGDHVKPIAAPFRIPAPGAKLTLVDYFATWCESSKRWIPKVEAIRAKYAAAGLVVVGVGHWSEETPAEVETFARSYGATFPVVLDAQHTITSAIPPLSWGQSIIVVDANGVVRLAHIGTSLEAFEEVDAAIGRLLSP